MAAPKGNTNAEKWTEETANDLFDLVLEKTREKTEYIVGVSKIKGFNCHFMGEAADEANTTMDILDYLKGKYKPLKAKYLEIKRKCERNCFTDSKKGLIIPSIAIVNLKSNHGWTDRVDQTTKGDTLNVNVPVDQWINNED